MYYIVGFISTQRIIKIDSGSRNEGQLISKNQRFRGSYEAVGQAVGQKQMTIDYLEKMIELAEKELKIDFKKKNQIPHNLVVPSESEKNELQVKSIVSFFRD